MLRAHITGEWRCAHESHNDRAVCDVLMCVAKYIESGCARASESVRGALLASNWEQAILRRHTKTFSAAAHKVIGRKWMLYAAHGRVLSACARRRISATDTRERWDNWCQAITLKTHPNREIESRQRDGNRAHFSHSQSQSELSSHGQMRRRYILIRKKDGPIACRRFNFSQGIFLIVFNSNHKFFLHGKLRNSYFSKHSMNT